MANINLVVANKVEVVESIFQATAPAGEAIVAGAPVRYDVDGKFTNANGTVIAETNAYGIATRTVVAGEALTAVRIGVLDGYDLTALAYGDPVYISDTDGRVSSAVGDSTVDVVIGRVEPGWSQSVGVAADKLLRVTVP